MSYEQKDGPNEKKPGGNNPKKNFWTPLIIALALEIHFRRIYRKAPMMVNLAVADLNAYAKAFPDGVCAKALPASASHAEFVQKTKEWNREIQEKAKSADSAQAEE